MGITTVTLKVKNPENSSKVIEGDFLVDSGAAFTVLPQRLVKKLGLTPSYAQKFTLADGKIIVRNIGKAFIEYQGRETAVPVVLGKEKDTSLLGVLTLEALGLALDPFERKLTRPSSCCSLIYTSIF
jgi:clan AA aspartic protease